MCIQRYNSHFLQSWRLGHLSQLLCHCIQNKQNGLGVFGGRILELGLLYKERRDDTTIYIISNDISSLNSSLQICLNLANIWIIKSGLKLNTTKTKCMLVHSACSRAHGFLTSNIDGLPIEQVWVFKFLGIHLIPWLGFSILISPASKSLETSVFFVVFPSSLLSHFFSFTWRFIYSTPLTTVMLCGPVAQTMKPSAWKLF